MNKLIIYKGISGTAKIQFLEEKEDRYYNLADATAIELNFRNQDQSVSILNLTNGIVIDDASSGVISFEYDTQFAEDIKLANNQSFYAKITKPGEVVVVPFQNALDVLELITG